MNEQIQNNKKFKLSEIEHLYGKNVHILSNSFLNSALAKLCSPETFQPEANELIISLYSSLLETVINAEFPTKIETLTTRMAEMHPEGVYQDSVLDSDIKAVCVNLARAGTLPSHVCYDKLNRLFKPKNIRQDHISIARTTDAGEHVTGSHLSGHKIGGPIDDAFLLFPDPMGATGSTIVEVLKTYSKFGKPKRTITMHCIITPEYLKNITSKHPEVTVYALRLDRGLSSKNVLNTKPGTHWDEEKGLNAKQYIIPGGGGIGEILNNAFV